MTFHEKGKAMVGFGVGEALTAFRILQGMKGGTKPRSSSPLMMVLAVICTPWVVILRREFGERYFSVVRVLMAVVFIQAWIFVSRDSLFSSEFGAAYGIGDGKSSASMQMLCVLLVIVAGVHLQRIWYRNRKRILWTPDSNGISHLYAGNGHFYFEKQMGKYVPWDDWTIYLAEFIPCLIVAWLCSTFDRELALFLGLGAVGLGLYNAMFYNAEQTEVFDDMAAQIKKKYRYSGQENHDKQSTCGYVPIRRAPVMLAELSQLEDEEPTGLFAPTPKIRALPQGRQVRRRPHRPMAIPPQVPNGVSRD